jgi:hypothetical protein
MNTYLKKCLVLSCCIAACLLAACVTTRGESLRASVARLDDTSSHFSAQIRYQGDDSRLDRVSRDAEDLAKAAHKLDQSVNRGDARADVEDDYRRVTDRYEQLHSQLADEGYATQNRQVLADFDRVTLAYRDVEAAMSLRTASAR